jgi:UDP-N-acetylglucosamine acyltransferase
MIDPRAAVDPAAELAEDVSVGPFAVIGGNVRISAGTEVGAHAVIQGPTRIGRDNRIHAFASVGTDPQDKKYAGENTRLEIGDGNTIREFVTINRGTAGGGGVTRIGDDNWIMAYVHIAHDCLIGSHTIFANNATLAGHVAVHDHAILGGFTLVHQFCRLGAHCFTAMGSAINRDVPPFVMVAGHMATPRGINTEGLRRRGFSNSRLAAIRQAYKTLYRSGLRLEQAREQLRAEGQNNPDIEELASFILGSQRSIVR